MAKYKAAFSGDHCHFFMLFKCEGRRSFLAALMFQRILSPIKPRGLAAVHHRHPEAMPN